MSGTAIGDKPPQAGLVDMGDIQFYNDPSTPTPTFTLTQDLTNYPGAFSEIVLNVTWAQLQPNAGGPLDTSFIQQATSEVCCLQSAIRHRPRHQAAGLGRLYRAGLGAGDRRAADHRDWRRHCRSHQGPDGDDRAVLVGRLSWMRGAASRRNWPPLTTTAR